MAHNLNFKNGNASFFSVGTKAWHNLGTIVDNRLTSEEAIIEAQLDYTVLKSPVIIKPNQSEIVIPDKYVTYRTDTLETFDVVGSKYHIVQNRECFRFFDAIVGNQEAIFETAGALGKGETIFITAKLPQDIVIANRDLVEQYLILTNSHNGKSAITCYFSAVRVVCQNTLNSSLSKANNKIAIKHTQNAKEQLETAHKIMGMVGNYQKIFQQQMEELIRCQITDVEVRRLIDELVLSTEEYTAIYRKQIPKDDVLSTRKQNQIQELLDCVYSPASQNTVETMGTAYGLLNGITFYTSNVKEFETDSDKMYSLLNGDVQMLQQRTMNLLTNNFLN